MSIFNFVVWLAVYVMAAATASRLRPLSGDLDHVEVREIQTGHNRAQRSVGDCLFPPTLQFQFQINEQTVTINLEKNEYLSRRVPLYVTTNGRANKEEIPAENKFAAYQDVTRGSAMLVSCQEDGTFRLHGSFRHDGAMYHMSHSGGAEPSQVHYVQRNQENTYSYQNDHVNPPDSVREELRNSRRNSRRRRAEIPGGNIVELLFSIDKNLFDKLDNRVKYYTIFAQDKKRKAYTPYDVRCYVNKPSDVIKSFKVYLHIGMKITFGQVQFQYTHSMIKTISTPWNRHDGTDTSDVPDTEYFPIFILGSFYDFQGGDDTAAKLAIEQYTVLLANEIDLYFSSVVMVDPSLSINIYLVGIEMPEIGSDVSWSTNSQAVSDGVTYISKDTIITNVRSWYTSEIGLPQHDHMMALSTLDMADVGVTPPNTGYEGIAYVGTVCSSTYKVSFTEVDGSRVALTAAHELGHGLGSYHDGSGDSSTCSPDAKNIMTSVGSTTTSLAYAEAQWTFSSCSVAAFKSFIDGLGTNCLKIHTFTGEEFEAVQVKSLPGTVYSLDQQCQLYNGLWSSSCDNTLNEADCYNGYHCTTSVVGGCSTGYYPLYPLAGTPCGSPEANKWCYRGRCIEKATETTTRRTSTTTSATTSTSTTSPTTSTTTSTTSPTTSTTTSTSTTSPTTSTTTSTSTTSPTTSTTTSTSTTSPTTSTTTSTSTTSPTTSTTTSTSTTSPTRSTTTSTSTTSPTTSTTTSTSTTSPTTSTTTSTFTTSPTTSTTTSTSTTSPTTSTITSTSTTSPTTSTTTSTSTTSPTTSTTTSTSTTSPTTSTTTSTSTTSPTTSTTTSTSTTSPTTSTTTSTSTTSPTTSTTTSTSTTSPTTSTTTSTSTTSPTTSTTTSTSTTSPTTSTTTSTSTTSPTTSTTTSSTSTTTPTTTSTSTTSPTTSTTTSTSTTSPTTSATTSSTSTTTPTTTSTSTTSPTSSTTISTSTSPTTSTTTSTSTTSPTTSTITSTSTTSPTTSTTTSTSTTSPTTSTTTSTSTTSPTTSTTTSSTSATTPTTTSTSTTSPTTSTTISTSTSPSTSTTTSTSTTSPTTSTITSTSTTSPTTSTTTSTSTTSPTTSTTTSTSTTSPTTSTTTSSTSTTTPTTTSTSTTSPTTSTTTSISTTSPTTSTTTSTSTSKQRGPRPCNERKKCCKRINNIKYCCRGSTCCSETWAVETSCYTSCCDIR